MADWQAVRKATYPSFETQYNGMLWYSANCIGEELRRQARPSGGRLYRSRLCSTSTSSSPLASTMGQIPLSNVRSCPTRKKLRLGRDSGR